MRSKATNFLNGVSKGKKDIIRKFIDLLNDNHIRVLCNGWTCSKCVWGTCFVSPDLDIVVIFDAKIPSPFRGEEVKDRKFAWQSTTGEKVKKGKKLDLFPRLLYNKHR